jgi:hypothetical protein
VTSFRRTGVLLDHPHHPTRSACPPAPSSFLFHKVQRIQAIAPWAASGLAAPVIVKRSMTKSTAVVAECYTQSATR